MEKFTSKNLLKWEEEAVKRELQEKIKILKTENGKKKAIERANEKIQAIKEKREYIKKLQAPYFVKIEVEWKKSRIWGMNPHAEVRINGKEKNEYLTGSASGCGYDKLSASIATATKDSELLKALFVKNIRKLNQAERVYGLSEDFTLKGGVGVLSHKHIFEVCGYKVDHYESKTSDIIVIGKR